MSALRSIFHFLRSSTMEVMLKNVRIAFCQALLGEAEDYQGNGVFRHSATFLIEPGSANDKAVKDAIKAEAVNVWAKKVIRSLEPPKGNWTKSSTRTETRRTTMGSKARCSSARTARRPTGARCCWIASRILKPGRLRS